jgi:predicted CoA-binding protein
MERKNDPIETLRSAKAILLVDWPDQRVPRALLNAGFTVFGFSPNGYTQALLVDSLPQGQNGIAPRNGDESGYLIFNKLNKAPASIDLVCIYRPEAEHAAIIKNRVVPLKAKAVWLQDPITSAKTAALVRQKGLIFIENADIVETALRLK